jgi:hypothetical protein
MRNRILTDPHNFFQYLQPDCTLFNTATSAALTTWLDLFTTRPELIYNVHIKHSYVEKLLNFLIKLFYVYCSKEGK